MSLTRLVVRSGTEDKRLVFLSTFIEMFVFLGLSLAYVLIVAFTHFLLVRHSLPAKPALFDVGAWLASVSWWMYALLALPYLGLVIIYWAPGDEPYSAVELWAFTTFLVLLLAALAIGYRKAIAQGWFGMDAAKADHYLEGWFVLKRGLVLGGLILRIAALSAALVLSHGASLWAGARLVAGSPEATFRRSIPTSVLVAAGGTIVAMVVYFLAAILGLAGRFTGLGAGLAGLGSGLLATWWIIHDVFKISFFKAILAGLPMFAWDAILVGIAFAALPAIKG